LGLVDSSALHHIQVAMKKAEKA